MDQHDQPANATNPPANEVVTKNADDAGKSGWFGFVLRWTIAIVGVTWVVSNLTIRDRVFVLTADEVGEAVVVDAALLESLGEGDAVATYEDPETGEPVTVPVDRLLHGPDQKYVDVRLDGEWQSVQLAGMRLDEPEGRGTPRATELFVYTPQRLDGGHAIAMDLTVPDALVYEPKPPQPLVRAGLGEMVRSANPWLLVAAVFVFPITLLCTGLRWWRLMGPLGIDMRLGRAYTLNMVGFFYNTFMLGSTGGDFIKAFYAGRHAKTGRKAAAWLSVFVDRVIGLLVLVAMGGTAAFVQYLLTPDKSQPVATACLQVAILSAAMLTTAAVGAVIASNGPLRHLIRRRTGFDALINKAAPRDVDSTSQPGLRVRVRDKTREALDQGFDVAEAYRNSPRRVVEAVLLTVPVHGAVIVSAMLAGTALDLPIPWQYYLVCVPVIVLAASIPISPQGAGVMEFFAVLLTKPQGATVAQAFALALCIRVVQILWNLTGGFFVLRGGFSQPTQREADEQVDETPASTPAVAT